MKIDLTPAELEAALWAVGMQTIGNACDIDEIVSCGISRKEAYALLRAYSKMIEARSPRRNALERSILKARSS